jgi:hypothetical protein
MKTPVTAWPLHEKRHQTIEPAADAAKAHEPSRQEAAAQERAKLVLDEARQATVVTVRSRGENPVLLTTPYRYHDSLLA